MRNLILVVAALMLTGCATGITDEQWLMERPELKVKTITSFSKNCNGSGHVEGTKGHTACVAKFYKIFGDGGMQQYLLNQQNSYRQPTYTPPKRLDTFCYPGGRRMQCF